MMGIGKGGSGFKNIAIFSIYLTFLGGRGYKKRGSYRGFRGYPKINIEPENDGLEDGFPFPGVYSQVPC